jgi:ubiquinone/menaquinone biosynthesis C-methylase UbiE
MSLSVLESVYPEHRYFGFTRIDGTVHFLTRVHALLMPDSTVLDVGCGRGQGDEDPSPYRRKLRRLGESGRTVVGIDVDSAGGLNRLIDEFRQIKDLHRWPVDDASVEMVFADYVLEHVQDPTSFFQEAFRVLTPGGCLCVRTPNFFGYAAFLSWLIPNRLHERILARVQPEKKSEDVFPTVYRCNTRRRLLCALRELGMESVVYSIEGEPGYLQSFPLGFRVAAHVLPYFPSLFKSTLLAFARKPAP